LIGVLLGRFLGEGVGNGVDVVEDQADADHEQTADKNQRMLVEPPELTLIGHTPSFFNHALPPEILVIPGFFLYRRLFSLGAIFQ